MLYLDIDPDRPAARVSSGPLQARIWLLSPKPHAAPPRIGLDGLIDSLLAAQHVMEMFRRISPRRPNARRSLTASPIASPKSSPKSENSNHLKKMGRDWPVNSP